MKATAVRKAVSAMRRWVVADGRVEPEVVFLVAGLGPEAEAAFGALPRELQAWRLLADMETARGRVWLKEGRLMDAGLCTGRAQAYRDAAEGVEAVLISALELRDARAGRGR